MSVAWQSEAPLSNIALIDALASSFPDLFPS